MGIGSTFEEDSNQPLNQECSSATYAAWNPDECDENKQVQSDAGAFIEGCGSLLCCFGIIMLIVGASTPNAAPRAYVVQQPVMPTHTTIVQQQVAPTTGSMPINQPKAALSPVQNLQHQQWLILNQWLIKQEILNWPEILKAADMYQKAGMFAEAGRIRKTYLK